MPDIDEIGESKAKSSSTKAEPDSAAVGLSLETKLANAREKRARILAARQAEGKRKGKSKKSQGLSKMEGAEPASVRHQLSERFSFGFAGTVLLVFVGSLGFGFGVSFGASAITGARVLPVASEASAAAAEPGLVPSVAAVSTTTLEVSSQSGSPERDSKETRKLKCPKPSCVISTLNSHLRDDHESGPAKVCQFSATEAKSSDKPPLM